jgi:hypothetical protein
VIYESEEKVERCSENYLEIGVKVRKLARKISRVSPSLEALERSNKDDGEHSIK